MTVFYDPNIEKTLQLSDDESMHALKVLRLTKGDRIEVLDGKGLTYICEIIGSVGKKCQIKILAIESESNVKPFRIHLVIAPTKSIDRIEWMLEKCIEIGLDEITFIKTNHSERKETKIDRQVKIAVSAMKQSGAKHLTKINELINFEQFLKNNDDSEAQKLIGYVMPQETQPLHLVAEKSKNYLFVVGPEGDFSSKEVDLAAKFGYTPVSLGTKRLRTETAGLVACHSLVFLNEI